MNSSPGAGSADAPKLFCSYCGTRTVIAVPPDDSHPRRVCPQCHAVHYENPLLVVGCVPEFEGRILLCRRAIEPRHGFWTVPAGFMELDETLEQGAARECLEEAQAEVDIGSPLALMNVPESGQVHVFFRARMRSAAHGAGQESLETRLVDPADIPWDDLAFPTIRYSLRRYLADRSAGTEQQHITTLRRRDTG